MTDLTDLAAEDRTNYFLMLDPAWEPADEDDAPPVEAIIGLWPVDDDGHIGRFQGNPEYEPADEDSPTDPLDALLRLAAENQATTEQLQLMLRQSLLDIAMNGDGRPLILPSPDEVPCVVVATSAAHRRTFDFPQWRRADLEDLVLLLADGVDVLVNVRTPAMTRLSGDFIRATLMLSDDEMAAAFAADVPDERIAVLPWEVD